MSRSASALAALLLLALGLGCGKYGPPVRASAVEAPAKRPSFAVPLPVVPEAAPAPPAQPTPLLPELEEEPPPEGAP